MRTSGYTKYKSSGIEWLGDVPEHWEVKSIFRIASKIQTGPFGSQLHESDYVEGGIPLVNPAHIIEGRIVPDDQSAVDQGTAMRLNRHQLMAGDIIMGRRGEIGRCAVATDRERGWLCGTGSLVIRIADGFPNYLALIISSAGFSKLLELNAVGTTMLNLNPAIVGRMQVPAPPVTEQCVITAFLDHETVKLDRLMEKKRALIEKLKEKRAALISRTVTRSLPPDDARAVGLDPHPKLKPSGIDWLGDMPEHWRSKRLKFELLEIEQGWSPQCDNAPAAEGEWGVLKAGAVNESEFDPTENKRLPDEEMPLRGFEIKTGDFLISRANTRELLGSAALVRKVQPQLLLCDKLYRLRICKRTLNPEFLLRFMRSIPGHYEFERDASGSSASMQNISQESIRNLWIPVPPYVEQSAIAEYLDRETAKIDRMVDKVKQAIERLQEYRTALITAAVTGKIDVRETAARPSSALQAEHQIIPNTV